MLPVTAYNGKRLNYPLGVDDLPSLTERRFDVDAWRALPQYIFMGAIDGNDAAQFSDAFSDEERDLIYSVVGRRMQPDRWQTAQRIYLEQQASVTFVTYGGVGHWTDRRINDDVASFFRSILRRLGSDR